MTKTQVKKELLDWTGGRPFISLTELCGAMHIGKDRARTIVSGLSYFSTGRRKDFLVEDVAKRISERATPLEGDMTRTVGIPISTITKIEQKEEGGGDL